MKSLWLHGNADDANLAGFGRLGTQMRFVYQFKGLSALNSAPGDHTAQRTAQRSAWLFAGAVFMNTGLVGCATPVDPPLPAESQAVDVCTEPRPQVCTTLYAPVCAVHRDGHEETLASACNACAIDTVQTHRPGRCEEATSS